MSSEDKQGGDSAALVRDLRHGSWTAQVEEMLRRAADRIEELERKLAVAEERAMLGGLGVSASSARALTTDDYMLARKCMEGKTGVDFIEGFADFYKAFALSSTQAPSASAEHDPWKEAVIDGLICAHIYSKADEEDPRKALNKLLAWEQSVALDPRVSSDAAALIEQGRRSALSATEAHKE